MRRLLLPLVIIATACTSPAAQTTPDQDDGSGTLPRQATRVEFESVLDGDSVRVTLGGESTEVRLLGINAPERDECWSQDSRDALILATSASEFGLIGSEEDRFGRLLAYLYADGQNLNEQQVSSGNAIALANDHDLLPDFLAAEEEAAALELGMWNPTACGPERTATGVRIWAIEPDAPGRDDRNPNGEFVALTNDAAAADLSGWILRDESSQHRYTFPDGFVLDEGQIITVRSGCGTDTNEELYWCADGTVWTNSGDTVLLLDASGSIVERQRYSG